ncbi:hypothetical protein HYPSUDRAFT_204636 [Hypholoma sublateritium FD-334 SS-4]|uniref:Uncharacterized protein n=1 Tax=Hypholoma sublateritium (strain FD-334 SS-4) TaxID=945553 RepID=A0A0D2NRV0_HYPSF|nr:hypothetical protein HYPSUDRAFT_204636 [Hypholoma sublateritium FD-334 SS-4]
MFPIEGRRPGAIDIDLLSLRADAPPATPFSIAPNTLLALPPNKPSALRAPTAVPPLLAVPTPCTCRPHRSVGRGIAGIVRAALGSVCTNSAPSVHPCRPSSPPRASRRCIRIHSPRRSTPSRARAVAEKILKRQARRRRRPAGSTPPRARVLAEKILARHDGSGLFLTSWTDCVGAEGRTIPRCGAPRASGCVRRSAQGTVYARLPRPIKRTTSLERKSNGITHQELYHGISISPSLFLHSSDPTRHGTGPIIARLLIQLIDAILDMRRVVIPTRADLRHTDRYAAPPDEMHLARPRATRALLGDQRTGHVARSVSASARDRALRKPCTPQLDAAARTSSGKVHWTASAGLRVHSSTAAYQANNVAQTEIK